ncbi:hypothetical protein D3C76_1803220 [compost metagenome]
MGKREEGVDDLAQGPIDAGDLGHGGPCRQLAAYPYVQQQGAEVADAGMGRDQGGLRTEIIGRCVFYRNL